MRDKIIKKLEKTSMNIVIETGSWYMFGEKKVPKEMIREYMDKKNK